MRSLVLSLLFLTVTQAHANIIVDVYPSRPMVVDNGLAVVTKGNNKQLILMGRWFLASITVKNQNSEPITLNGLKAISKSNEGTVTERILVFDAPLEIQAGDAATLERTYIDELADSPSYVYIVSLEIDGFEGTASAPGPKLSLSKTFKTN